MLLVSNLVSFYTTDGKPQVVSSLVGKLVDWSVIPLWEILGLMGGSAL